MQPALLLILITGLFLLPACSGFGARQAEPAPMVATPQPLSLPISKNWQLIEKAPNLSNEQGRLPFQMEQSVQPEGAKPIAPVENRKIESAH